MRRVLIPMFLIVATQAPGFATAHPGDDGHSHERSANVRVWKDAEGLFEWEASFVAIHENNVVLARMDGSSISIPLRRLSDIDQAWVVRRVQEIRAVNELWYGVAEGQTRFARGKSAWNIQTAGFFAIASVVLLAGVSLIARRPRFPMPGLVAVFGLCALTLSCTANPEPNEEIVASDEGEPPAIVAHFGAFKNKLKFRWNDSTLFIDSNGLPDHPMMVGITNWQQQVPLPQPYAGRNAWQIPLKPRMAETPISAKKALYRGAIALAVNGVPIFNALNNRGEDAFAIGELDEYGGHCGKGDDYHYHAAPLHLQKLVGEGNPIGYAMDGFPLYGLTNEKLDEFNGRFDAQGDYRYHSTRTYPYINGGLKGVVQVKNDGVEPQPRAMPVRPAQNPLRGAKITGFTSNDEKTSFSLKYEVNGKTRKIDYAVQPDGGYQFKFVDESGQSQTETYTRREGPEGKGGPDKKGGKKDDEKKKKGKGPGEGKGESERVSTVLFPKAARLKVASNALQEGKPIPAEFTGDGDGVSPPVSWSEGPPGTKAYALNIWHVPGPGSVKSYWVVYNIPAHVTSLPKNMRAIGTIGANDKGRAEYEPMKSKGPGIKEYHLSVFALSAEIRLNANQAGRADVLDAIKDLVLAEGTLTYTYERQR
jgi:phosphatidylethanolamine-binding protein (PEBP) family uncharacterized protein